MKFDNMMIFVIFLGVCLVGGVLGGLVYFNLNILDSTLREVDFDIPLAKNSTGDAPNVTTFQDILDLVVYPILGLKNALPYLVYFMMFAFIIGLAITAYLTSKNPVFFVLHLLFTLLITYFSIGISNTYIELISDPTMNTIMSNFPIYNKMMIYFPQIILITSIVFATISFINVMKPSTATSPYGLNYGGDY